MGTAEKLVDRILKSDKVPNDVKPKELLALAKHLGWKVVPGKGSHFKFLLLTPSGEIKTYPIPLGHAENIGRHYIAEIRRIVYEDEEKEANHGKEIRS